MTLIYEESNFDCPKCGKKMIYKTGRFGRFLACPDYPACRSTVAVDKDGNPIWRSVCQIAEENKGFLQRISSNSSEIGKVVEEIQMLNDLNDVDFQIAFSTKYLLDALKSFEGSVISFYFTGEIKPFVITNTKEDGLIQLILPVRIF